jgi:hypothetical protein
MKVSYFMIASIHFLPAAQHGGSHDSNRGYRLCVDRSTLPDRSLSNPVAMAQA